jgi:hypothetical protein
VSEPTLLQRLTGPHAGGCNCWPHVSVSTASPLARLIEEWTLAADQATSIPSGAAYHMCVDMLRNAISRSGSETREP